MRLLVHAHGDAPDADGRAQSVDVKKPVPHDEKPVLRLDQLAEGVGLDAGLDTGRLLLGVRLSAVILNAFVVLDHGLVAASSEGKLHSLAREFSALHVGLAAVADAHRDRDPHLVSDADGLDLLQQIEVVLLQGLQVLPLHDEEVFVLLQLADDGIHPVEVPDDLPVDHGSQQGSPDLVHALHGLFVVVQIDQTRNKAHAGVLFLQRAELRLIIQICGEDPVCRLPCAGDADPELETVQLRMEIFHLPDAVHLAEGDLGEQILEAFQVLFLLPDQSLHRLVLPGDNALPVHEGVGHVQIVRETLLELVCGHGPSHQGLHNVFPARKVEMDAEGRYEQREGCPDQSCLPVGAGDAEGRGDRCPGRDQRPRHVCAQEFLRFLLFLHDHSTPEQMQITAAVRHPYAGQKDEVMIKTLVNRV